MHQLIDADRAKLFVADRQPLLLKRAPAVSHQNNFSNLQTIIP
jgi:hypothetical protein